ncbi:MAG: hypothetical protein AB7U82_07570 [Blastocatellales bacterium]
MRVVHPRWHLGIASAILIAGTLLCTVLATVIVDKLLIRPAPASVNTLLPGWTYGAVAILKVCLFAGVAAGSLFMCKQAWRRWLDGLVPTAGRAEKEASNTGLASKRAMVGPRLAILSVLLPSVAPLVGALGVVLLQAMMRGWGNVTMSEVEQISRGGVVVMGLCLVAGFAAGGVAVVRGKGERSLALLGVMTNACLMALFWYWRFYAAGFDQDRWAPN